MILLITLCSCQNTKGWVYRTNDYDNLNSSSNLQKATVAVLPFSDKRLNENHNNYAMYMIPLFPFGYQDLNSPETVQMHANSGMWLNYNPKEDFAKAAAEELNSTKIFKEAFFSTSHRDSDYYLSGEIVSTDYNAKLFSYGLSVYGPLLWYIGLPATHVANDLKVKLSLVNSKTKKVVFAKNYMSDHYSKTGWIYSLPNDFRYPEMLAEVYKQFVKDLSKEKF